MQRVQRSRKLGDIHNAKRTRCVTNPDFSNAATNDGHGLPVVWIQPLLNLIYLMAGIAPRGFRKSPKVLE
jgi:hypothetical protein